MPYSIKCVKKVFYEEDADVEEYTPSSLSTFSQAAVISCAQGEKEIDDNHEALDRVPKEIIHVFRRIRTKQCGT
ncbi:hypothetical protein GN958_ATG00553 [Phytophthora infestans]|uniref:Uncharacterized protein n=1 Tax=Phytophthora infestans TaxID=4787 RepID=A0A8S9VB73_PHYIN|nr:hypothetical protein GN958_ATG00553 [Phytophthora infestans]